MEEQRLDRLAKKMVNKIRCCNLFKDDEDFKIHKNQYPFYSELKGIELTLDALGISYEYKFDSDNRIISVKVGDCWPYSIG